jgi:hypothetical protein
MRNGWRSPAVVLACAAVLVSAGARPDRAFAFGPAAHYVVMEKVAAALPPDGEIRQAMAEHLDIAGAGASGPDLPYCQLRGALGYAPWADRYHYDRVGTFAAAQLQKALASHDAAQVAWAAGWVTHVAGDMACHGLYVNPEAGVYLANEAGRALHRQLEAAAEVAVWVDAGGHPPDSYDKSSLPGKFCATSALPLSLVEDTSSQVFGSSPGHDYLTYYRLFKTGLGTGIGYSYWTYPEAQRFLSTSDRSARLAKAVEAAVKDAAALLQAAERGDYADFSDAWNLDAGKGGRPFGTLTVNVRTGDARGAGTDADIYFGLVFDDGTTKEWLLDKEGYNDFERGDNDDYYLFLGDKDRGPAQVTNVYLRMGAEHGLGVAWQAASIRIRVNGAVVLAQDIGVWLNNQGDKWQSEATWRSPPARADRPESGGQ